jgi:hypothetical protein
MVNYSNGKIYKIESHLGDKIYIGSTTKQYLSQRMEKHRYEYKFRNDRKCQYASFELFDDYGAENCKIVLLESYPCSSRDELTAKEAQYIKSIKCVNIVVPGRTKSEYYACNKDKINVKTKAYYENNKEKIKQYLEQNKEKIKEQHKAYYRDNKERISQPFNCECGCIIKMDKKARHHRTQKHIDLMQAKSS